MRPARRSAGGCVGYRWLRRGGPREPPVYAGRQPNPWVPAFAGMTGFEAALVGGEILAAVRAASSNRERVGLSSSFRRRPEPGTGARGGKEPFRPIHPWAAYMRPALFFMDGDAGGSRRPPLRDFRALPACEPGEGQPQGVLPTLRVVRWQKRARGSSVDPRARFLQMRAVRAKAARAPRTSRRGSRRRRIGSCRFRSPRSGRRR